MPERNEEGSLPTYSKREEWGRAIWKGALGGIPFAGSMIAEIVDQIIPEQRMTRLESYVRMLGERLSQLDREAVAERAILPEAIDVFEDGAVQAARALSTQRIEYIARLVAGGMTGEERDATQAKRLLKLLAEIDDEQIILLANFLRKNLEDRAFQERHKDILRPAASLVDAPDDVRHRALAIHELALQQLLSLGLIKNQFDSGRRGRSPDFDPRTGTLKVTGQTLTPLGGILLDQLGLAS